MFPDACIVIDTVLLYVEIVVDNAVLNDRQVARSVEQSGRERRTVRSGCKWQAQDINVINNSIRGCVICMKKARHVWNRTIWSLVVQIRDHALLVRVALGVSMIGRHTFRGSMYPTKR